MTYICFLTKETDVAWSQNYIRTRSVIYTLISADLVSTRTQNPQVLQGCCPGGGIQANQQSRTQLQREAKRYSQTNERSTLITTMGFHHIQRALQAISYPRLTVTVSQKSFPTSALQNRFYSREKCLFFTIQTDLVLKAHRSVPTNIGLCW